MPFCLDCTKRNTCREICPELEKTLPKPRSGGHMKEKSYSPQQLVKITDMQIATKFMTGGGKRKHPHIEE